MNEFGKQAAIIEKLAATNPEAAEKLAAAILPSVGKKVVNYIDNLTGAPVKRLKGVGNAITDLEEKGFDGMSAAHNAHTSASELGDESLIDEANKRLGKEHEKMKAISGLKTENLDAINAAKATTKKTRLATAGTVAGASTALAGGLLVNDALNNQPKDQAMLDEQAIRLNKTAAAIIELSEVNPVLADKLAASFLDDLTGKAVNQAREAQMLNREALIRNHSNINYASELNGLQGKVMPHIYAEASRNVSDAYRNARGLEQARLSGFDELLAAKENHQKAKQTVKNGLVLTGLGGAALTPLAMDLHNNSNDSQMVLPEEELAQLNKTAAAIIELGEVNPVLADKLASNFIDNLTGKAIDQAREAHALGRQNLVDGYKDLDMAKAMLGAKAYMNPASIQRANEAAALASDNIGDLEHARRVNFNDLYLAKVRNRTARANARNMAIGGGVIGASVGAQHLYDQNHMNDEALTEAEMAQFGKTAAAIVELGETNPVLADKLASSLFDDIQANRMNIRGQMVDGYKNLDLAQAMQGAKAYMNPASAQKVDAGVDVAMEEVSDLEQLRQRAFDAAVGAKTPAKRPGALEAAVGIGATGVAGAAGLSAYRNSKRTEREEEAGL